ncbi:MAG: hypothetical protein ACRDMV_16190 [Streptosporangiales bacterium]
MSHASAEALTAADERRLRAHAVELRALGERHGISELRYASPGRLLGRVAPDRDLFDVFAFQREASHLLGAEIELFSEAVLNHEHVSPDLAAARKL